MLPPPAGFTRAQRVTYYELMKSAPHILADLMVSTGGSAVALGASLVAIQRYVDGTMRDQRKRKRPKTGISTESSKRLRYKVLKEVGRAQVMGSKSKIGKLPYSQVKPDHFKNVRRLALPSPDMAGDVVMGGVPVPVSVNGPDRVVSLPVSSMNKSYKLHTRRRGKYKRLASMLDHLGSIKDLPLRSYYYHGKFTATTTDYCEYAVFPHFYIGGSTNEDSIETIAKNVNQATSFDASVPKLPVMANTDIMSSENLQNTMGFQHSSELKITNLGDFTVELCVWWCAFKFNGTFNGNDAGKGFQDNTVIDDILEGITDSQGVALARSGTTVGSKFHKLYPTHSDIFAEQYYTRKGRKYTLLAGESVTVRQIGPKWEYDQDIQDQHNLHYQTYNRFLLVRYCGTTGFAADDTDVGQAPISKLVYQFYKTQKKQLFGDTYRKANFRFGQVPTTVTKTLIPRNPHEGS